MALINCPECGKQVSEHAKNCPNCGCPLVNNNVKEQSYRNKQSPLGIISLLISFIPFVSIISIVLANVDILADINKQKHTCSKVAIGISTVTLVVPIILIIIFIHVQKTTPRFVYSGLRSEDNIEASAKNDVEEYKERIKSRYNINSSDQNDSKEDNDNYITYETIYSEYKQKLEDATPTLIDEYNSEAEQNQNGIEGLAEIYNAKVEKLAKIDTDGTSEMATYMYKHGSGKYEEYEEWAKKLSDVYMEEAKKISDAYMESAQ